jgi:carboxyl-terminal processing protease
LRKTSAQPLKFNLTRAIIKAKSVKSRLLEADYGYIRVAQFQARTTEELATAVKKLYEENKTPLKGLVLDLRDDPGGLLNGAVGVSAAFLPKDSLVVYTEGRTQGSQMRLQAKPANYMMSDDEDYFATLPAAAKNVPLIVLVNGGSASASEIVAGALQDQKRAIIMGEKSFGKGSVQTILPTSNGAAIKLTTARYFTPSGRSIQAEGIEPDIALSPVKLESVEKSDYTPVKEADLSGHLQNAKATTAATDATAVSAADKEKDSLLKDYALYEALNLLKGISITKTK